MRLLNSHPCKHLLFLTGLCLEGLFYPRSRVPPTQRVGPLGSWGLCILRCPGLPWEVQIDLQTVPGVVKIDPWRVPGSSWKPLSSSGGLLVDVAGVLEGSRGLLGGVLMCLGAILGSSWRLLGSSWDLIRSQKGARRVPKRVGNGAPSLKRRNVDF